MSAIISPQYAPLTDVETKVVHLLRSVGSVSFLHEPGAPAPEIGAVDPARTLSASVIRRLLRGEPFDPIDDPAVRQVAPKAIEIRGAIIHGVLDLEDIKGDANPYAPNIALESCLFVAEYGSAPAAAAADETAEDAVEFRELIGGRIDISDAMLSRFSLKRSRFVELDARGAQFFGGLDLSWVSTSEDQPYGCANEDGEREGRCWADLSNASIQGSVTARHARLCAPAVGEARAAYSRFSRAYALMCDTARVQGSLKLNPGFRAIGGLNIDSATIGGSVLLDGATLVAKTRDTYGKRTATALSAQMARIAGSLILRGLFSEEDKAEQFLAVGSISLYGAKLGGEFFIAGGRFKGSSGGASDAIIAYMAEIDGSVRVSDQVNHFTNERLETSFDGGGLRFDSAKVGGFSIALTSENDDKDEGVKYTISKVVLSNARVAESISISGSAGAVFATNTSVFGDVDINGPISIEAYKDGVYAGASTRDRIIKFHLISFENANVGGSLTFGGVKVADAIIVDNADVEGNLSLLSVDLKKLRATNTQISGNFEIVSRERDPGVKQSRFGKGQGGKSISARNARVGGRLKLDARCEGIADFASCDVTGECEVANLTFDGENQSKNSQRLNFSGSKFASGLKIESIWASPLQSMRWARSAELPFYKTKSGAFWRLVEVADDYDPVFTPPEGVRKDDVLPIRSFLWDGDGRVIALGGKSPPIHMLNAELRGADPLNDGVTERKPAGDFILNRETAPIYLEFFCTHVWGEAGAFRLVRDLGELNKFRSRPLSAKRSRLLTGSKYWNPLLNLECVESETPDAFEISAVVHYSNALFISKFRIFPNGMVEMTDDEPFAVNFSPKFIYDLVVGQRWLALGAKGVTPSDKTRQSPAMRGGSTPLVWKDLSEAKDYDKFRSLIDPDFAAARRREQLFKGALAQSNLAASTPAGEPPEIDLSDVRAASFDDDSAKAWKGALLLRLDGFNYEHLYDMPSRKSTDAQPKQSFNVAESETSRAVKPESRLTWLARQYRTGKPTSLSEFRAEPYEHLAQWYYRTGRYDDGSKVIGERLALESKLRADAYEQLFTDSKFRFFSICSVTFLSVLLVALLSGAHWLLALIGAATATAVLIYWRRAVNWIYKRCFGYAMNASRALATFFGCLFVGGLAADFASDGRFELFNPIDRSQRLWAAEVPEAYQPILTIDFEATTPIAAAAEARAGDQDVPRAAVPCGDEISPGLYAIDVFIPLLDLRQEIRCAPSAEGGVWFAAWRWGKAAYAILGWIVTSLTILTLVTVIKRRIER